MKKAASAFIANDPMSKAATIAYYTVFSMPAVLILTIMAAATVYDEAAVRAALLGQAAKLIGPSTAVQIGEMLEQARVTETRFWAKAIGSVALAVSAGTVFASLQTALNDVWKVEARPGRAIWKYLATRLLSLALVGGFGFLLLVSLVLDTALVAFSERLTLWLSGFAAILVTVLNLLFSFGIITLVFAFLFKLLPDARVRWRNVWSGAVLTTLLFTLGKYLIGLYISYAKVGDAYGAAGAIIIILVWVYYSTVIMLFGAHFTHQHTLARSGGVAPSAHAVRIPDPSVQKAHDGRISAS
ncbi:MAG: YihY/virulence factor BrkB family protein [Flavobacteriales bacterium]